MAVTRAYGDGSARGPLGPLGIERRMLNIQSINEAYERVQQGDVRYRFVIDMGSLKNERV
jgi:hypothetical protein